MPNVLIDNQASNRFTVIEVNARDRPALLHQLAHALFQSKVTIHSAHVATYGERAVDTFYLTDLIGDKIAGARAAKAIERRPARCGGAATPIVHGRESGSETALGRATVTEMPVLGIGGLFFRAADPDALTRLVSRASQYRPGLRRLGRGHAGRMVLGSGGRPGRVRAVHGDDRLFRRRQAMDAQPARQRSRRLLDKLNAAGIEIETRAEWNDPATGQFARIHDPEGNAIELWEPPRHRLSCGADSAPRGDLFGREHHQHLPAFHARIGLDLGGLDDIGLDALEERHAELAMAELAAAEAQRDLDLVALADELDHLLHLGVVIMVVDVRTHLDLLDLLRLLRLAGEIRLFLRLVFELADIEELGDGRIGANYLERGYYRPSEDCIMFTRDLVPFCPVCRRAINRVLDLYTAG